MIFEGVLEDNLWTLSFGLPQFHGHGSWLMCKVALFVMEVTKGATIPAAGNPACRLPLAEGFRCLPHGRQPHQRHADVVGRGGSPRLPGECAW